MTRFISILRCISVGYKIHFDINFGTSRLFCAARYSSAAVLANGNKMGGMGGNNNMNNMNMMGGNNMNNMGNNNNMMNNMMGGGNTNMMGNNMNMMNNNMNNGMNNMMGGNMMGGMNNNMMGGNNMGGNNSNTGFSDGGGSAGQWEFVGHLPNTPEARNPEAIGEHVGVLTNFNAQGNGYIKSSTASQSYGKDVYSTAQTKRDIQNHFENGP
jgi:hypothetical protein